MNQIRSSPGASVPDQALAVPVEPEDRLDPSGFDPSRSMVPYGPDYPDYPNAPSDWDGGPYLCRDGQLYHMRGYGWGHGLGCWKATADWDRIAYRPASAIEARQRPDHEDGLDPQGDSATVATSGGDAQT